MVSVLEATYFRAPAAAPGFQKSSFSVLNKTAKIYDIALATSSNLDLEEVLDRLHSLRLGTYEAWETPGEN